MAWFHASTGSPLGSVANTPPRFPPPAPSKRVRSRGRARSLPEAQIARLRAMLKSSVFEPASSGEGGGFSSDDDGDDAMEDVSPEIRTPTRKSRSAARAPPPPLHTVTPDLKPGKALLDSFPSLDMGTARIVPDLATRSLTPPPPAYRAR